MWLGKANGDSRAPMQSSLNSQKLKKILGARERGDSHMKMDGVFVASLMIDHDGNQCDMFTHRA